MRNKIFKALSISVLLLSCSGSLAYAWTPPTLPPTDGNVAAPINTSATDQTKDGGLTVWGRGILYNLFVPTAAQIGSSETNSVLEVFGNVILKKTGTTKSPGNAVVLQSWSDTMSASWVDLTSGDNLSGTVWARATTIDDCRGADKTNKFACNASMDSDGYSCTDVWVDNNIGFKQTVTCASNMASYTLRSTDGSLQFLNSESTPAVKFTLNQDGSVAMGPSAASFVINPSGNTTLGGTLGVTSASNGDAITITSSDTSLNVDGTTGSGSILVNKPWLKFWNNTGTGARASIYAKNGDFNGTVTATEFSGAFTGTSATATSLAGGALGSIPYQSAAGVTAFLSADAATAGKVLTSNGGASPSWTTPAGGVPTGTAGQTLRYSGTGALEATSTIFVNNSTNVGIGTNAPTNKLDIYNGNVILSRELGTNILAGSGPQLILESPSGTSVLNLVATSAEQQCGGSCVDTTNTSDVTTAKVDCTGLTSGITYTDVYIITTPSGNASVYKTIVCKTGTANYSIGGNDGSLEFKSNSATPTLTLGQDGTVTAKSTVLAKGALTVDLTSDTTGTSAAVNVIYLRAGNHADNKSTIVTNKSSVQFWSEAGTGGNASIIAKNGNFDGSLVVTGTATSTFAGDISAKGIKLTNGAGPDKVLTSDATGLASWKTPTSASSIPAGKTNGDTLRFDGANWATSTVLTNNGYSVSVGGRLTIDPTPVSPDATNFLFGDGTGWKLNFAKALDAGVTKFMTLLDNGNVGIGTTAPSAVLDVKGALNVSLGMVTYTEVPVGALDAKKLVSKDSKDFVTTLRVGDAVKVGTLITKVKFLCPTTTDCYYDAALNTYTSSGTGRALLTKDGMLVESGSGLVINSDYALSSDPNLFAISDGTGTNKLTIDKSGNVGKLTVAGNINKLNSWILGDTDWGANTLEVHDNSWDGVSGNAYGGIAAGRIYSYGGLQSGGNSGYEAAAGELYVAGKGTFIGDVIAKSFSNSSDLNLKKNIVPLSGQLEKISQLQGVSFDWKKDDKHNIGLIAQEVEKVYPDLVSTDKTTGLKSVQYGNLVAPLIEAVKELKTENNLLKVRLEKLENK